MMGKADAVIFDFDGVIADTREDVWDSVEYAANAVGGAVDKEFMEDTSHVALPEEELFRHINPLPPGHLFDVFCSHIKTHYRTMNQFHKTRMYPGLEEIFRYLAGQGTVWAVSYTHLDVYKRQEAGRGKGFPGSIHQGWAGLG